MPKNRPFLPFLVFFIFIFFLENENEIHWYRADTSEGRPRGIFTSNFIEIGHQVWAAELSARTLQKTRKDWDGPPQNGARPPKKNYEKSGITTQLYGPNFIKFQKVVLFLTIFVNKTAYFCGTVPLNSHSDITHPCLKPTFASNLSLKSIPTLTQALLPT